MELSKRLEHVACLVTKGAFVADIGTDHAYVPVYLLQQGICPKAIAMDINKGPLERARLHIKSFGLSKKIETRLSNGLEALGEKEVDSVIIAGMGGPLMIRILTAYPEKTKYIKEFILQPQSEIKEFRTFLAEHDFCIIDEDMVFEEGKYYPMMKAVHGKCDFYRENDFKYGKLLIQQKNSVLKEYIEKEIIQLTKIIDKLEANPSDKTKVRIQELKDERKLAKNTLEEMNDEM